MNAIRRITTAVPATAVRGGFWLALAVAVTMALLPHPPTLPIDQFGDKFEHMLAFAVLSALAGLAYRDTPLLRIAERLSFLGALIELFQSIPVLHRDCDVRDWIADSVAILVTLFVLQSIGIIGTARR